MDKFTWAREWSTADLVITTGRDRFMLDRRTGPTIAPITGRIATIARTAIGMSADAAGATAKRE